MENKDYQAQGFIDLKYRGFKSALALANDAINKASGETPASERSKYRSAIKWEGSGYSWFWILRA